MTDTESRESDLAVMESNEYKQKRRLRAILDAHDEVERVNREGYELLVQGEISRDGFNLLWLRAVKRLIREIYPLLQQYWSDLEDRAQRDNTEVSDPEHADEYLTSPTLGTLDLNDRAVVFEGLADIADADEQYPETHVHRIERRHRPDERVSKTVTKTVPKEISEEAFKLCKTFLSEEHDLRVQFEEINDERPYDDWREDHDGF